jgi:hypothetical protein
MIPLLNCLPMHNYPDALYVKTSGTFPVPTTVIDWIVLFVPFHLISVCVVS